MASGEGAPGLACGAEAGLSAGCAALTAPRAEASTGKVPRGLLTTVADVLTGGALGGVCAHAQVSRVRANNAQGVLSGGKFLTLCKRATFLRRALNAIRRWNATGFKGQI